MAYSTGIPLFRVHVKRPETIRVFNIYSTFQNIFFEAMPSAQVFSRSVLLLFTYISWTRLSFRGKNCPGNFFFSSFIPKYFELIPSSERTPSDGLPV